MESLFEEGALDVTFTPCTMKKSRPGIIISVLCSVQSLDKVRKTIFERSSSIGFREQSVSRLSLKRELETKETDLGAVHVKTVLLGERELRSKIEYDDRSRIAREKGISLEDAKRFINGT